MVNLSTILEKNPIFRKRESILKDQMDFVNSRYHDKFFGNGFRISPAGNLFECSREYGRLFRKDWSWVWRYGGRTIFSANISDMILHVGKEEVRRECRRLLSGLLYNCPPEFPNEDARDRWELLRIDCCLFWEIPFTSYIKKEEFEGRWRWYFDSNDYSSIPKINNRWWRDKEEWWLF